MPTPEPPLERGVTAHVPLRGEPIPLRWTEGPTALVERDDDGVVVQLPAHADDADARRAFKEFYLAQARQDVDAWLPKYLASLHVRPTSLRLRPLSSRWGSCSPRNDVLLDLALVLGRPSAFEYILVHELCHLLELNHSRWFWKHVETHCPQWRLEARYLRDEGGRLKAKLRSLVAP